MQFCEDDKIPINRFELRQGLDGSRFTVVAGCKSGSAAGFVKNGQDYTFSAFYNEKISLDRLPVVGKIPLVSEVAIDGLALTVSTCDAHPPFPMKGHPSIKKGAYFLSSLSLPDNSLSICLPLSVSDEHPNDSESALESLDGKVAELVLNQSIGPFLLRVLRFSNDNGFIWLGLDAAFAASGLKFELDGLAIGYNTKSGDIGFALLGLSLDVNLSAVQITGGFLKKDSNTYAGSLLVRISALNIIAVGAYTAASPAVPVDSIFAFAALRGQIGGPPCFFVTGIALGFGYNRALSIPSIDHLDIFPLIMAAEGTLTIAELLKSFAPKAGQSWVAAGVLFNSFKMIDSTAILSISWGSEVEVNLIGRSLLNVPFNSKETPIAHAVLLLKASFKPANQLIAVDAMLSGESYVLSKDCHLTGGFAFYTWYGGDHAGDFVLTLGGYHPRYNKPAHYPNIDRLGFNWRINSDLSVWGGVYFALTPSCVMAGGILHLRFSKGIVEAWFDAYMDIYMQWKPYHYDISIGVNVGCKVDLALFTVRLELGCSLHIWGPEFSGKARVKLWCISFTISFGANSPQNVVPMSFAQFTDDFLPKPKQSGDTKFGGCVIQLSRGLLPQAEAAQDDKPLRVCAGQLAFIVKSIVPSKEILLNAQSEFSSSGVIFMRPCQSALSAASLRVEFRQKVNPQQYAAAPRDRLEVAVLNENLPSALWGGLGITSETVLLSTGLSIKIKPNSVYERPVPHMRLQKAFSRAILPMPKLNVITPDQKESYQSIRAIIGKKAAVSRKAILDCLGADWIDTNLTETAKDPQDIFCSAPILTSIGG